MLWESRLIFADESQAIRRKSGPLGAEKDHAFPIRKSFVPHSGHVPWVAGRPFLSVTACGLLMSLFVLHLKQYASTNGTSL
jgi:hypothetical protein